MIPSHQMKPLMVVSNDRGRCVGCCWIVLVDERRDRQRRGRFMIRSNSQTFFVMTVVFMIIMIMSPPRSICQQRRQLIQEGSGNERYWVVGASQQQQQETITFSKHHQARAKDFEQKSSAVRSRRTTTSSNAETVPKSKRRKKADRNRHREHSYSTNQSEAGAVISSKAQLLGDSMNVAAESRQDIPTISPNVDFLPLPPAIQTATPGQATVSSESSSLSYTTWKEMYDNELSRQSNTNVWHFHGWWARQPWSINSNSVDSFSRIASAWNVTAILEATIEPSSSASSSTPINGVVSATVYNNRDMLFQMNILQGLDSICTPSAFSTLSTPESCTIVINEGTTCDNIESAPFYDSSRILWTNGNPWPIVKYIVDTETLSSSTSIQMFNGGNGYDCRTNSDHALLIYDSAGTVTGCGTLRLVEGCQEVLNASTPPPQSSPVSSPDAMPVLIPTLPPDALPPDERQPNIGLAPSSAPVSPSFPTLPPGQVTTPSVSNPSAPGNIIPTIQPAAPIIPTPTAPVLPTAPIFPTAPAPFIPTGNNIIPPFLPTNPLQPTVVSIPTVVIVPTRPFVPTRPVFIPTPPFFPTAPFLPTAPFNRPSIVIRPTNNPPFSPPVVPPNPTPSIDDEPTQAPSISVSPSISAQPSLAPSVSFEPTISSPPSISYLPSISNPPTSVENTVPPSTSFLPTISVHPSTVPSVSYAPSVSYVPSVSPSPSIEGEPPSSPPSISLFPTMQPSLPPSVSILPSVNPSVSVSPSVSSEPTPNVENSIGIDDSLGIVTLPPATGNGPDISFNDLLRTQTTGLSFQKEEASTSPEMVSGKNKKSNTIKNGEVDEIEMKQFKLSSSTSSSSSKNGSPMLSMLIVSFFSIVLFQYVV